MSVTFEWVIEELDAASGDIVDCSFSGRLADVLAMYAGGRCSIGLVRKAGDGTKVWAYFNRRGELERFNDAADWLDITAPRHIKDEAARHAADVAKLSPEPWRPEG